MEKSEKKALKKAKRLKRLKSFFIVLIALVCLITFLNVITVKNNIDFAKSYEGVIYDDQLKPVMDDDGYWSFTTDRDFRVMQLTDIHQGGGFLSREKDQKSLNAVAAMITKEKPDLVIVTGDIAYPVPYQAGTFNNMSGAKQFAALMEQLGVYWTVNLGNHDSEIYSYYDREKVSDFYENEEWKYCLYQSGPEETDGMAVDGYGNHIIKVKNSQGIITQAFVMMDSHAYTDGDYLGIQWKYDNIHDNQVDWYKSEIIKLSIANDKVIKTLNAENEEDLIEKYTPIKSLAFFHIPLVEARETWLELEANGFKDTESAKYIDGIIGETGKRIFCGVGEDGLFEMMSELGSTKAMFNGHDHYNNATFSKDGIIFSYGNSIDYLAYSGIDSEGSQRGCTIIICKPDTTFAIDKYNYYSDRYELDGFKREEVIMQFEDVTYQVPQE